jgi:glycosyltransferase involved in cell wall biosynthesis
MPDLPDSNGSNCPKITAIILTYNEEQHLERCLASLKGLADEIVVVDCFSTDATTTIAQAAGARLLQHAWVNYASQFNWALTQLEDDTGWVLRIDADEYLTPALRTEIMALLPHLGAEVDGIYCGRSMVFQGRLIRHGGVAGIRVLRLFRYGRGRCENRWMDEHIKVTGATVECSGELIDENLNPLTWWTDKHNRYASREAVDLLNLEYGFMARDSVAGLRGGNQAGMKRWVKEFVYARLPGGLRACAYFFYRYVVRLGFLDGREGAAFHFLQGFWYRYLVDAKIAEVKRYMQRHQVSAVQAIKEELVIDLEKNLGDVAVDKE